MRATRIVREAGPCSPEKQRYFFNWERNEFRKLFYNSKQATFRELLECKNQSISILQKKKKTFNVHNKLFEKA